MNLNNKLLDNIIPKLCKLYFCFYLPEISENRKLLNKPYFHFSDSFYRDKILTETRLNFITEFFGNTFSSLSNYVANDVGNYLDFVTCLTTSHTVYHPLQVTLQNLGLSKETTAGDGHCILHSWCHATSLSLDCLKSALLLHYTANYDLYSSFGAMQHELEAYIYQRSYNNATVDLIINMLCNIYNYTG